jgi:hypothetical protein
VQPVAEREKEMNQIPLINQVLLWERRLQIESERQNVLHGRKYEDEAIDQTSSHEDYKYKVEKGKCWQPEGDLHICGSVREQCQKV